MQKIRALGLLLLGAVSSALAADVGGASCFIKNTDAAGERVYLLCEEPRLLVTENHGATWTSRPLPAGTNWRAVKFLDARRGYVAGDKGALATTADGGYNWQTVPLPARETLTAIQWKGESGWVAGHGGVIVHTADGGRTWALQNSQVNQPIESLYFADANHGWAVGWVGTVTRTTDGGRTWQKGETPAGMVWSLSSVYFRDPLNGWAVGFNGEILRSRDGGATWQTQESPVQNWLTSVIFDRAGRGWIAADECVLLSEDGGETWRVTEPTTDRLFLTWLQRTDDSLWLLGQYGVLKRSPDDVAWRQLDSPTKLVVEPSRYMAQTATPGVPRS
ncbi:MAG: hypothetical protein IT159_12255 [Bryobacterales bacterium]|nr:hypothetical protein [Bryobacterales bacterium]